MTVRLHIDPVGGVAGDMLLGALIDAGASIEAVRSGLAPPAFPELRLEASPTRRHSLTATRVDVVAPPDDRPRDWAAIRRLIDAAQLPERARSRAQAAFRRLAVAEGRIHGVDPERVHFHEVGAVDSIADICGVALALEDLGIDAVTCSSLPLPSGGTIDSAHGPLPLPAPAALELLRGVPVHGVDATTELVTPTGAALVVSLAAEFGPAPDMRLDAVGYGAGHRDSGARPNVVRVLVGVAAEAPTATRRAAVALACTVDDLMPELVPDAVAACSAAGALDAWVAPVQMKKGRPGLVLTAIARPDREAAVAEAMLRATTTLGVRVVPLMRYELDREQRFVEVLGMRIAVKVGRFDGEVINVAPEHDDVVSAASALGRPVKAVWATAFAAAQEIVR